MGEKQNGGGLETTTHGRLVRDGRCLLLLLLLVCTLCLRQSLLLRLSLRLRLLLLLDAISLAEGRVGRMRGGDGGGGRGGVMAGDLGTVYGGHGRCWSCSRRCCRVGESRSILVGAVAMALANGSDADEGVDTEHDGGRGGEGGDGMEGRRGEDVEGYLERWSCGWGDE